MSKFIRSKANIILWPIAAFIVIGSSLSIAFCSPVFHPEGCQINLGFVSVLVVLVTIFALLRVLIYYQYFNNGNPNHGYGVAGFFLGLLSILVVFFAPGLGIILGSVGIISSLKQMKVFASLIAKEGLILSSIGLGISLFKWIYLVLIFFS